tara:strand:- start:9830 stop:10855 length:1026 start_codon:yes stop_codon:yes gene_type:complete
MDNIELNKKLLDIMSKSLAEGGECYQCDGKDPDCPQCNGSGYVQYPDDPQEPSQEEIDKHTKKESAPYGEPSQEEEMYNKLIVAYENGEEDLAEVLGMSMEELDDEMSEYARDHNLHMDDDRDEVVQGYIEDVVHNADFKDYGTAMYDDVQEGKESVEDCIRKTLEKEGGAAGKSALVDACKKAGYSEEECNNAMSKMSDVKKHEHGDYILESQEELEELAMPCGAEEESPQVEQSVEFRQHKNTDKGSVTIEASADDMQELSKVLKLAGLTLPKDMNHDQDPIQPVSDEPVMVVPDAEDGDKPTMNFPKTDVDPNMSQDKAVLTSVIRDKLRDYLKNSQR